MSPDIYGYTLKSYSFDVNVTDARCFLENTLILTINGYIPIQQLHVGDQIKTQFGSYKKITAIGKTTIINNVNNKNCMYKYTQNTTSELIQDLFVTGLHNVFEKNNMIYRKIKASDDRRATKWNYSGSVNLWHIAFDKAYGIYANGLLVESISYDSLKRSGMTITEYLKPIIVSSKRKT